MKKHKCEEESGTTVCMTMATKLTPEERKARRVFDKAVRRWYRMLLIDPVWTVGVIVIEDEGMKYGDAFVDLSAAEYYAANIHISRSLLSLPAKELERVASSVACHELLHIATADFQRGVLTATGDNEKMQEELRYRYEQLVSRFSMILTDLAEEEEEGHEPAKGKDPRVSDEVLKTSDEKNGG